MDNLELEFKAADGVTAAVVHRHSSVSVECVKYHQCILCLEFISQPSVCSLTWNYNVNDFSVWRLRFNPFHRNTIS